MKFIISIVFAFTIYTSGFATSKADSLIDVLKNEKTDSIKLLLLRDIGREFINNNVDTARYYYSEGVKIAQKRGLHKELASLYRSVGNTYYNQASYDSAISNYTRSLNIFKGIDDKKGVSRALLNIGTVYLVKGEYKNAIGYYFETKEISKQIYDSISVLAANINIAMIYSKNKQYDKAIVYYLEGLELSKNINREGAFRNCMLNIGLIYKNKKDYSKATEFINEALKLNLEENDLIGVSQCYSGLGEIYNEKNDLERSIHYYKKSLEIDQRNSYMYGIASHSILLAQVYHKLNKVNEALKYGFRGLELSKELNTLELQREANEIIYEIYLGMDNYKEAIHHHIAFKEINDSIYNLENSKQIKELQSTYELEKKESENESLRKENQINELEINKQRLIRNLILIVLLMLLVIIAITLNQIKIKKKANKELQLKNQVIEKQQSDITISFAKLELANKELASQKEELVTQAVYLEEAVETKNKFFSIIAHDLKNPFNIILGFSSLLQSKFENLSESKIKKYIDYIAESSEKTFKLLTDLLEWARSQSNHIDILPEKMNLLNLVENSIFPYMANADKKKIKIIVDITDELLITTDRYSMSTVFGNIFSNSIKFTKEGGKIKITAFVNNDSYIIQCEDTGIGMSPDDLTDLFLIDKKNSTQGTDNESGTGFGLLICKDFIELNNGKLVVESEEFKGTKVSCYLPKNIKV